MINSNYNKNTELIKLLIEKRLMYIKTDIKKNSFYHISIIVPINSSIDWIYFKTTIGENSNRERYNNTKLTTHAEIDSLNKYINLIKIKKIKNQPMELIVIRVNKSGNLCESAPCLHCTNELKKKIKKNGMKIKKLHFSKTDGSIVCIDFNEWTKLNHKHISRSRRI